MEKIKIKLSKLQLNHIGDQKQYSLTCLEQLLHLLTVLSCLNFKISDHT